MHSSPNNLCHVARGLLPRSRTKCRSTIVFQTHDDACRNTRTRGNEAIPVEDRGSLCSCFSRDVQRSMSAEEIRALHGAMQAAGDDRAAQNRVRERKQPNWIDMLYRFGYLIAAMTPRCPMSTDLPLPALNPGQFQKSVCGNPAARRRAGGRSVRDACKSPVFTGAVLRVGRFLASPDCPGRTADGASARSISPLMFGQGPL
jgi:hypothetical protein